MCSDQSGIGAGQQALTIAHDRAAVRAATYISDIIRRSSSVCAREQTRSRPANILVVYPLATTGSRHANGQRTLRDGRSTPAPARPPARRGGGGDFRLQRGPRNGPEASQRLAG